MQSVFSFQSLAHLDSIVVITAKTKHVDHNKLNSIEDRCWIGHLHPGHVQNLILISATVGNEISRVALAPGDILGFSLANDAERLPMSRLVTRLVSGTSLLHTRKGMTEKIHYGRIRRADAAAQ